MKKFKFSLLFALLVAFLAACGSDDGGSGATLGSLLVTVNGPESATVSVTGANTSSQTVAGSTTFADLTPGSYVVSGAADGYETTNETVVIVGGNQSTVSLSLPKIAQPAVSSVSLSPASLDLEVGEIGSLQATVAGNEDLSRDDMGVTYQSSNTNVATVSREGVVTAFGQGASVITATSDFDPSYFDTSRVTVSFDSSNQNQTDGVLGINVAGNEGRAFDFTVTGPGGFSETVSTSARTTLTVPAGSYTVSAEQEVAVDAGLSYVVTGGAQQTVTVTAGQLEEVAFAYGRVNPAIETNIATFDFISAVDAQGEAYATRLERNVSKDVILSASQSEEVFCVTFAALDAAGDPVPNARVGIDVTGAFVGNANVSFDWDDVITVVPIPSGNCGSLSLNTSRSVDTQQVAVDSTLATDDEGQVTFGLFATDGIRPNPFFTTGFGGFEEEPAKIVLTASNANTTIVDELKVWFINITHLTYADDEPDVGAPRIVNTPFRVVDSAGGFDRNHVSTPDLAGNARLSTTTLADGSEVGAFLNSFNTEGPNVHRFDTWFYQKQPEVPNRILNEEGFDPEMQLGYMRYAVIVGQDNYSFNPNECENLVNNDLCFDTDGVSELVLSPTVTADQLPLDACVRATYVARASFRDDDVFYDFDLKSYTFCKTFGEGGFLSVVKFADNHVLSWAGPRVDNDRANALDPVRTIVDEFGNPIEEGFRNTLRAFNHAPSSDDPFTSTYRIFVTNPSNGTIKDLVISDDLPAELGVVLDSITPSGDFPTYDADNHVLTWDFRDPGLAPLLDELEAGEYVEFSYEVYARQKPGFHWTAPVRDTPVAIFNAPGFDQGWVDYVRAPMYPNYDVNRAGASVAIGDAFATTPDTAYPDPYCITNGDDFANTGNRLGNNNDVTVEFNFDVAGSPRQVLDYDPIADESDICVVRPLFNITKRRVSEAEINRGETVIYELITRQVDRVNINAPALSLTGDDVPDGLESSAFEREYAWLSALYPWEFGVDADGRGHRADAEWYGTTLPNLLGVDLTQDGAPLLPEELVSSTGDRISLTDEVVAPNVTALAAPRRSNETYKRRDNPFGSNVIVFDVFDVGLDYVSDNDLMIINLDNEDRFHTVLDSDYAQAIGVPENRIATVADGRKARGSGIRAISGENPDANPIADKRFQFEEIDIFLPDDVGVSTITLRAGLASAGDDDARTPVNGSTVGNRQSFYLDDWDSNPATGIDVDVVSAVTGEQANVNVDGVWYNCAYLDAYNMNQPTPILQPAAGTGGPFLIDQRRNRSTSYGASWYNGQRGPNIPEVAYIDGGFFFGRPFDLRLGADPYPFLDSYGETAGINDYPWDRNDTSNAIGEFLSTAEVAELAARGNPLSYQPPYNPANLPVSYDLPDNIGIGEWNTADFLAGSVNGVLAITRPIEGTGVENLNVNDPHDNGGNPLPGRNKDEVTPVAGPNPYLQIIDSVTGAIRNTNGLQRGIEGCAPVRAIQDVPPPPVGSIEFTPRGETFQGGTAGANLVAVQALVPVGRQYYYQIDFLNAGDTTIEDIVFTAQFEIPGVVGTDAFFGRQSARYVANNEQNATADAGDDPPSQIFEGRISPQFPLDVPQVRPFRLIGAADVVDTFGTSGVAGADETNVALVPVGDPNVSPTLNRVVFNNGGEGYDLRTGRVLRLMIKAEGIELGSEQALFTAYFDNVDGTDADNNGFVDRAFREIRDETDIGNNPNN